MRASNAYVSCAVVGGLMFLMGCLGTERIWVGHTPWETEPSKAESDKSRQVIVSCRNLHGVRATITGRGGGSEGFFREPFDHRTSEVSLDLVLRDGTDLDLIATDFRSYRSDGFRLETHNLKFRSPRASDDIQIDNSVKRFLVTGQYLPQGLYDKNQSSSIIGLSFIRAGPENWKVAFSITASRDVLSEEPSAAVHAYTGTCVS